MMKRGEIGYGALDESEDPFLEAESGDREFRAIIEKTGSSIQKINSSVSSIEKSVRQIGTASDSENLRNRITSVLHGTNQDVAHTQQSIKRLKELGRTLTKERRLQEERITRQFMETVQRVSKVQQTVASRMKAYPNLPKQQSPQVGDDFSSGEPSSIEAPSMVQKQEEQLHYDLSLLEERERQVRDIESAIVDVNEIFRDLGAMVTEQGDMIDSIEANVERGSENVSSATQQLEKAQMYQTKARRKQCCIVVTLIVVVILVAVVIVVIVKR